MSRKFRKILALSFAIFWVAAANHCVLEECFFLPFAQAGEHAEPLHLPNHPGHEVPHQHHQEDSSHTHGQPCPISVLLNTRLSVDSQLYFAKAINPLIFTSLIFSFLNSSIDLEDISFYPDDSLRNLQRHFFSSLTIASNAPPFLI